jgi:TetR/AcrR family transcriptional repressor of nem operon
MPLSKQHKEQTRRRIVRTASHQLRSRGLSAPTVPEMMRQAGLTHGGFYAHFPNRDALVAEACVYGLKESQQKLLGAAESAPPGQELRAIVESYLSPAHRDAPADGCVVAALAAELARAPSAVRAGFAAGLEQHMARIAIYLPGADEQARRQNASVLLSGMVGALMMARTVADPARSDRMLAAARDFYIRAFATTNELGGPPASERAEHAEQ